MQSKSLSFLKNVNYSNLVVSVKYLGAMDHPASMFGSAMEGTQFFIELHKIHPCQCVLLTGGWQERAATLGIVRYLELENNRIGC